VGAMSNSTGERVMKDLINFLLVVLVTVIIPYLVIWGVYFDILPESLEVIISQIAVASAIVIIVGGNLFLMYSDIKTKRYSKS
jgi:heme/copper-type cytochrome/quinol oxidase subunit 4